MSFTVDTDLLQSAIEQRRPPEDQPRERHTDKKTISEDDSTTTARESQIRLFPLLQEGAENAIATEKLMELSGIPDRRSIRRQIAQERAHGLVILSGKAGYYRPAPGPRGREEAAVFVDTLTAKGVNTLRAADSARAWLAAVLPGQQEIGGDNGEKT